MGKPYMHIAPAAIYYYARFARRYKGNDHCCIIPPPLPETWVTCSVYPGEYPVGGFDSFTSKLHFNMPMSYTGIPCTLCTPCIFRSTCTKYG